MMVLRDGILASLAADAPLLALLKGPHVYDGVPRGAPFPHVNIGECDSKPWDTQSSRGFEHIVTLHVWTRGTKPREAQALLDRLDAWAERAVVPIAGMRVVSLRNIFWSALNTPEAGLFHGVMRLRIVTEPVN
jgi:hypothetical protein